MSNAINYTRAEHAAQWMERGDYFEEAAAVRKLIKEHKELSEGKPIKREPIGLLYRVPLGKLERTHPDEMEWSEWRFCSQEQRADLFNSQSLITQDVYGD